MPATPAPQETVAVWGDVVMVRLLGEIEPHVSPDGTLSVRLTVPVKPLRAVAEIVEVKELPEAPDGEVAAIMKSVNVNAAVVEWDSVPLVPVMVSV